MKSAGKSEGTIAQPRWSRRKEARPAEIVEAAMDIFAANGFAAANLADVAKRAGVAKGTLYRYYDSKEELFRAVVQHAAIANLQATEEAATAFQGSFAELLPPLLTQAALRMKDERLQGLVRMVIAESRAFPDLARIWHDTLVDRLLTLLTGLIAKAQARGEVRDGDPRLHAFSVLGPLLMGLLFHQIFGTAGRTPPDLPALARQHAETVLRGLLR